MKERTRKHRPPLISTEVLLTLAIVSSENNCPRVDSIIVSFDRSKDWQNVR